MFRLSTISNKHMLMVVVGVAGPAAWMGVASAGAPEPSPAVRRIMYTWTGSTGAAWSNMANWNSGGAGGYPDDTNDDAMIDSFSGTFDIVLSANTTIDDLTVAETTSETLRLVDDTNTEATLTCDTIIINGPDENGSDYTTVVAYDRVKIQTN